MSAYMTAEQVAWRLKTLLDAGYTVQQAERLAHADVDLHRAVELVTMHGCNPATATEILL